MAQGNQMMAKALGAMLAGQEEVYKKLPVYGMGWMLGWISGHHRILVWRMGEHQGR